jgi:hypothetical protein
MRSRPGPKEKEGRRQLGRIIGPERMFVPLFSLTAEIRGPVLPAFFGSECPYTKKPEDMKNLAFGRTEL